MGDIFGAGEFSLLVGSDRVALSRTDNTQIAWPNTTVPGTGRRVITLTFDSRPDNPAARVELYLNGIRGEPAEATPPQFSDITLITTTLLLIGNHPSQLYSIAGKIHYVAIYSVPLTPDEIANNAARLLEWDDGN